MRSTKEGRVEQALPFLFSCRDPRQVVEVNRQRRVILLTVDAGGILVQGLAHSSHDAPFELSFHQHGVDRLAAVMGGDYLDHLHPPRLRTHLHLCRLGHEGIAGAEIPVFGEQRRRLLRRRYPGAAADNGKGLVRILIGLQGIVEAHSPLGTALDPDAV